METSSQIPPTQPEHEGEHWLRLLDLGHLADQTIPTPDGPIQGRDFLDICRDKALPMLIGFESLPLDDPRREKLKGILQRRIGGYVVGETPN